MNISNSCLQQKNNPGYRKVTPFAKSMIEHSNYMYQTIMQHFK